MTAIGPTDPTGAAGPANAADPLAGLVGWRAGPSAWRSIEQSDIDAFARLTGDRQWIHVDERRARRESPYATTIAHGNLTLSLIDGFRDELLGAAGERLLAAAAQPRAADPAVARPALGVNYGYDRVRFPAAVPSGSRMRARVEVVSAARRPGGWCQLVQRFTVELEGSEKPACVADSVIWVHTGPGPPPPMLA